jgi:outer membrane lipoprotein-sorting protein
MIIKRFGVCFAAVLLATVSSAFAQQEFTADQILAKLDEKAKVFKSLQAAVEHHKLSLGRLSVPDKGTLVMVPSKGSPKAMWDMTTPLVVRRRLDEGKAIQYNVAENVYQEFKYDAKSEKMAYLMLGFGTPAATITKGYKAAAGGRETIKGVNAVILELTALNQADEISTIKLWLDPATWAPVQTRLYTGEKVYDEFKYSNVQLNKSVSGSAFDLKMKPGAKKQ